MQLDLDGLAAAYDRSRRYVDSLVTRRDSDVSPFWAQHFSDRVNFPSFDDMLVLRRGGFTYGVGEVSNGADEQAERAWAEATWHVARQSAPDLDVGDWPESSVGSPYAFALHGHQRSGSSVINALTSHRIATWCRVLELNRPLRVLEIGPGYGQGPAQLIERLPVEHYAICDLPENLFLSSFYLQVAQSRLPVAFAEAGTVAPATGIVFATPPDLPLLRGPFDLVVNAYSLQEMNLDSVRSYFEFIAENLSDDGFFYSLNAHGKAGVRSPADYDVERFDVAGFAPLRRYPFFLFATEPYELVLRRSTGRPFWKEGFAIVARLLQLGFHEQLSAVCTALVADSLSQSERDWIRAAGVALDAQAPSACLDALDAMRRAGGPDVVANLLEAFVAFAAGLEARVAVPLSAAIDELEPAGARVRALVVRAATTNDPLALDEIRALAPHLAAESELYAADRLGLRIKVAELLGLTPPRKPAFRTAAGAVRRVFPRD
jgi:putative sugar O-methyltransferase